MRARFVGTAVAVILAAAVVSQGLYEVFLVPRLGGFMTVPPHLWLVVTAPLIASTLACGWLASWREVINVAALTAVGLQAAIHVAAAEGRPGWHKAVEAPLSHWTFGLASAFLIVLSIIVLGRIGHAALRPRESS